MEVFVLRDNVVCDYADYVQSFIEIRDPAIREKVEEKLRNGFLWPEPLLQLNPAFEPGESTESLVCDRHRHELCLSIFYDKPDPATNDGPLRFHRRQIEVFEAARAGESYALTTDTRSGKSMSSIVPIVDHVLRRGSGRGIPAIIVYPASVIGSPVEGEVHREEAVHRKVGAGPEGPSGSVTEAVGGLGHRTTRPENPTLPSSTPVVPRGRSGDRAPPTSAALCIRVTLDSAEPNTCLLRVDL